MAYHGYIPYVCEIIISKENPKILEIGIDCGATYFSLLHFLIMQKESFFLAGIDIKLKDMVKIQSHYFTKRNEKQMGVILEENSLTFLQNKNNHLEFDIIMLDGDHNYYTVSQELEMLHDNFSKIGTTIIADDYGGRWSEKDLFYESRKEGKDNPLATPYVETNKHGVKAAINDFLKEYSEWTLSRPIQGEPVVLQRMG